MRLLGAITTSTLFYLLMTGLATALLVQDRRLWRKATWRRAAWHLGTGHGMARRTRQHLLDYLRPDFHPSRMAGADALAAEVLTRQASRQPPVVVAMGTRT